jgi:predicted phage-related endonuclease
VLTAEDQALRRTWIGASEAPILVGVSPYARTVHDVFLGKVSAPAADEQTPAQAFGHMVEPIALRLLAKERGLELSGQRICPRRHPVLDVGATPDELVVDKSGKVVALAEAKAPGLQAVERWGESGDPEGVPDEVLVQVTVQMAVCHVPLTHLVAVLGNEPRFYVVEYSESLAQAVLEACQRFWDRHVVPRVPPPVDGSDGADRMLRGLFPKNRTPLRAAPASAAALARMFLQAREQRLEAEKRETLAKQQLELLLGEDEGLQGQGWRATWKTSATGAIAWKDVAAALSPPPELVEAHRMNPARVFRCVATKESR